MIDPKELRLGNIVSVLGVPKKVLPNLILELYQHEQANKVSLEIHPIKLTEEWLVKLGFEKFKNNIWNYKDRYVLYDRYEDTWFFTLDWMDYGEYHLSDIHELQNMFFWSMYPRAELKIKE